jgi:arylsulfatase A-like enzyme
MVAEGEYVAAHHGKWHLGDEIFAQHGFREWVSIEDGYRPYYREGRDRNERSSYHHWLLARGLTPKNGEAFGRGEACRLPEELGKPAFLTETATRFIRENRDRPFALYVNFLEPHMPFFGPRDREHSVDEIVLPDTFHTGLEENQSLKARFLRRHYYESGHSGLPLKTEADWRRLIANYWGLCSLVDTAVGHMLDTLEECGLRENTIVVFTSDHGDMMGAHRLLAKCVMFQEAVRVPFVVRLPGQREGRRVTGPVSQVDVVPTLLDLMDQSLPGHLQGKSLRPWLEEGGKTAHEGDVVIEWNGGVTGSEGAFKGGRKPEWFHEIGDPGETDAALRVPVRTIVTPDGWKLNWRPESLTELYNLNGDEGETCNLVSEAARSAVVDDLMGRIRAWQVRTGDTVDFG